MRVLTSSYIEQVCSDTIDDRLCPALDRGMDAG